MSQHLTLEAPRYNPALVERISHGDKSIPVILFSRLPDFAKAVMPQYFSAATTLPNTIRNNFAKGYGTSLISPFMHMDPYEPEPIPDGFLAESYDELTSRLEFGRPWPRRSDRVKIINGTSAQVGFMMSIAPMVTLPKRAE